MTGSGDKELKRPLPLVRGNQKIRPGTDPHISDRHVATGGLRGRLRDS
jgi:hypothetical protein